MESIKLNIEVEEIAIDEDIDLLLCCCGCSDEIGRD